MIKFFKEKKFMIKQYIIIYFLGKDQLNLKKN
jgi:hypothetical protein